MFLRFIGEDKSIGFVKGKIYKVKIVTHDDLIWVIVNRRLNCPYTSIENLSKNWRSVLNCKHNSDCSEGHDFIVTESCYVPDAWGGGDTHKTLKCRRCGKVIQKWGP